MGLLNTIRLILITLWLGAAILFSAVVAPAAFGVLRSFDLPNASEIAGTIVTRTLSVINVTGFVASLLVLVSLFARHLAAGARTSALFERLCLGIILLTTGIGQCVIAARMRTLRVAMQVPIDQVPLDDARRVAFQSLHGYSVAALSIAMIAALLTILLLARSPRS